MAKIVTLGEILLRLKPPQKYLLRQARHFEADIGGAEVNVSAALANYGHDVSLVSAVPTSELGELALRDIRSFGIETSQVRKMQGRLGLYFLEDGSDHRSGCVVYDRTDSVLNYLSADNVDWDKCFDNADVFHISGITPACSESASSLGLAAIKEAKARNIPVTLDLNFRERLWQYGKTAYQVMPEYARNVDHIIAGRGDCGHCLNIDGDGENGTSDWAISLASRVLEHYPNLTSVAISLRHSHTADEHDFYGVTRQGDEIAISRKYEIKYIVDRVGTGDAFSAGLVHGIVNDFSLQDRIDFGAASACLKHSIHGDKSAVKAEAVTALMTSKTVGLLRR